MDNSRLLFLLDLKKAEDQKDVEAKIDFFNTLTNLLFKVTQSLYDGGEKPKYHQREIEGKFFRFGLANQSIITLMKGNEFKLISKDCKIGDVFSIKNIIRMQFESFLIMHYLFFDDVEEDELNFRYEIYKLHGLQKQANMRANTKKGEEKRKKILEEVEECQNRIIEYDTYKCAKIRDQKWYLKPSKPKLFNTEELFKRSGLNNVRGDDMWSIFSNYTHAEYISDRQYNSIYRIEKSINDEYMYLLTLMSFMTSRLIMLIVNNFKSAKLSYASFSDIEKAQIELWSGADFSNVRV
ncbi:DUF5677 domain-containing protein [Echinicola shivajiensis]|uniref:DUF5677 domain-containing protein n=1 Tax=Echinicola shivajiensis TaxID=1035916 RepID=UPI001BFCA5D3|nr:DUF5677 domain-containing protein [Echinicola shivajiensis]